MKLPTVSKYYTFNMLLYITFATTLCYVSFFPFLFLTIIMTRYIMLLWFAIEVFINMTGPFIQIYILALLPIEYILIKTGKLEACEITAQKKLSRILVYSALFLFVIGTVYWYYEFYLGVLTNDAIKYYD